MSAETPRPSDDADHAAEQGQRQRLDQELGEDVAAARADRLADADLAGPLADRDQHDVHDPDAADDQRDRGDPAEQEGQRAGDRRRGASSWVWSKIEKSALSVGGELVAVAEQRRDRRL